MLEKEIPFLGANHGSAEQRGQFFSAEYRGDHSNPMRYEGTWHLENNLDAHFADFSSSSPRRFFFYSTLLVKSLRTLLISCSCGSTKATSKPLSRWQWRRNFQGQARPPRAGPLPPGTPPPRGLRTWPPGPPSAPCPTPMPPAVGCKEHFRGNTLFWGDLGVGYGSDLVGERAATFEGRPISAPYRTKAGPSGSNPG